jgi:hypothetical protein
MMELKKREDIIKALECCSVWENCDGCPYRNSVALGCTSKMMRAALALIEELSEEIKDLEAEYDRVYEQAEADIRGNIADGGTSCHWCIAGHRADAVRKMQEKIRAKSEYGTINMSPWQLEQIAKEMLED